MYPGFYSTSDQALRDIWGSNSTLFVFDTNCLLNLYRCEEHTREEILNVMRAIANRTWIPFQVGLEYQRNRRSVIEESIASLSKIEAGLQRLFSENILSHGSVKKHLYNSLSEEVSSLQLQIRKPIEEFINEKITPRIESKKQIADHDFIRDHIDSIISDKVGELPTQEKIDTIDKEGELRYDRKVPPGFKDASKKSTSYHSGLKLQDKFGDLYLWKEIIEKSTMEDINNVIFVCDDNKDDWWYEYGGQTHGPLESLKTEICKDANIENFKLINQSTFLHDAKKYLRNVNVSEASLKEVESLSQTIQVDEIQSDFIDDSFIDKLKNSRLKNEVSKTKYYSNTTSMNFLKQRNLFDLDSAISLAYGLVSEYNELSYEADHAINLLRKNRVTLVNIVGPDLYLNCKRDINISFREASETADKIKERLDILENSSERIDILSHLLDPMRFKIHNLHESVIKTNNLLAHLE